MSTTTAKKSTATNAATGTTPTTGTNTGNAFSGNTPQNGTIWQVSIQRVTYTNGRLTSSATSEVEINNDVLDKHEDIKNMILGLVRTANGLEAPPPAIPTSAK